MKGETTDNGLSIIPKREVQRWSCGTTGTDALKVLHSTRRKYPLSPPPLSPLDNSEAGRIHRLQIPSKEARRRLPFDVTAVAAIHLADPTFQVALAPSSFSLSLNLSLRSQTNMTTQAPKEIHL